MSRTDWMEKDYDANLHPEWVGLRHKLRQEIQETNPNGCGHKIGTEVFI